MEVLVDSITLEGIRSFTKKNTFRLKGDPGLYLLSGENRVEPSLGANGSGKSSLWAGLCWALYEKDPRGLRAGNVGSWQGENKTSAEVEIWCSTGQPINIERSWNPNALHVGGKPADQSAVDDITRLSLTAFLNSVYIGQFGRMFLDLSPAEKSTLFSEALDLDGWVKKSRIASQKFDFLKDKANDCNREVARLKGRLSGVQDANFQQMSDEWEQDQRDMVSRDTKKLKNLKDKIEPYMHSIPKLEEAKTLAGTLAADEWDSMSELSEDVDDLNKKIRRESRTEAEVSTKLKAERKYLERVINAGVDTCPECGQVLPNEESIDIDSIKSEIDALEVKLKATEDHQKSLQKSIDEINEDVRKRQKTHSALKDKANAIERSLAEEKSEERNLTRQAVEIQKTLNESPTNPWIARIEKQRKDIQSLKRSILKGNMEEKDYSKKASQTKYWVQGFKDLRLEIIGDALARLESEVSANLDHLGMSGWRIEFSLDRQTKSGSLQRGFHTFISSPYNPEPVPWEAWSGGETQRLRLAATMALADVLQDSAGIRWNLEVWDEPSTWLSEQGIEDLLRSLRERAERTGKEVWIVDHRSLSSGEFSGEAVVIKDHEGSRVEWIR